MSTRALAEPDRRGGADPLICAHCGLAAIPGEVRRVGEMLFCCAGCETASAIIRESGLERFYYLPERRGARVSASGRTFAEFDHEAFQRAHIRTGQDGLAETTVYLEGIHCASCVWLVERVPLIVPGAVRAELDVTRGIARLAWDPGETTLSEVARALDRLGYRPHPFRGHRADEARRAEERAMLVRIGVAGAIAGNVMTIALALYSGLFSGMEGEFERYFRWLSLVLVTPALLWPGRVFFTSAWQALRQGKLHMDVPIAVALAAGFIQGALNTIRDSGPIYFDAVGTLIFLLLLGRYLQHRAQRSAADSAALLGALAPNTARIVEAGVVREVPTEALLPGMELEVRVGDALAADGIVEVGSSSLDLALLTGESRPVRVGVGERVFAGTVNLSSPLRVRVEEAGMESRIGRLLRDVEEGARSRPPVVLLADRMAGYFIAAVLLFAAGTAAIWWRTDPNFAIDSAIALLVVTCPCALAMATPLTFTVAIGRAARRGILIKGGHALETLTEGGTLFLDKTGTLTEGRMVLEAFEGDPEIRPLVVALERQSRHPVAKALCEAWSAEGVVAVPEVREVKETLGKGIEGIVNGRKLIVGRPGWVRSQVGQEEEGPEFRPDLWPELRSEQPPELRSDLRAGLDPRLTPVLLALDGEIVARAGFGDPIRGEAREAVRTLVDRGWGVKILSGDAPEVVRGVAARLGIEPEEAEGDATPERKRAAVEEARRSGAVVMVGDGVNDAAAISAATVGIAVRGGAEAAMAAADVYLARGGIGSLSELVNGAHRTSGIVRRNILIALGYNLVGVTAAMMGVIDPLLAAILMPASSVTVVFGAWRGRTFPRKAPS